jgi:hypothetical protein
MAPQQEAWRLVANVIDLSGVLWRIAQSVASMPVRPEG